jgi:hypothetical protein
VALALGALADRERLPDWVAVFLVAALVDVLAVLVAVPVRAGTLLLTAALGGA